MEDECRLLVGPYADRVNDSDDRVAAIARVMEWATDGLRVLVTDTFASIDVPLRAFMLDWCALYRLVMDPQMYWTAVQDTCTALIRKARAIVDDSRVDVMVKMVVCYKIICLPDVVSLWVESHDTTVIVPPVVAIAATRAGRKLLKRYTLDQMPRKLLVGLSDVPWSDDAATGDRIERHALRVGFGMFRRSQLWDRQAHVLQAGEVWADCDHFRGVSARVNMLFATLLLGFGRLEANKTIAVAHSAMLEEMLEMVPFLQE